MPNVIDLTMGQARAVISTLQLTPAPHSPLMVAMSVQAEGSEADLRAMGVLDEPWRQTILDLADPAVEIRLLDAAPAAMRLRLLYRGNDQGGPLTMVQSTADGVRLTRELDSILVAGELATALWEHQPPIGMDFTATLSPAGLGAWCASLDSIRALLFTSLLKRLPEMKIVLDVEELNHHLKEGFEFSDGRWLVTLLRSIGPSTGLDPAGAEQGAKELVELGLLTASGDGWQPSGEMKYMAASLATPLPACATALTYYGDASNRAYITYKVAINGSGTLWTIDYTGLEQDQPEATLSSTSGPNYLNQWSKNIDDAPDRVSLFTVTPPKPEQSEPEQESSCGSCGAVLRPGAAFCSSCGASAGGATSAPVCVSCGAALKPGAAFCSQCGTKQE